VPETTLDPDQLKDADREILDILKDGDRTKGFLVDQTGYHRNWIGHRLEVLEAGNAIECLHRSTALYKLAEDPRDEYS
jgi:hypothetical protein